MNVESIVVGPIETNCYLAYDQKDKVLIFDPGYEGEKIEKILNTKQLKPCAIINTHGHHDHINANDYLKKKFDIPVFFPEKDKHLIELQKIVYEINDFEIDYLYQEHLDIPGFQIKVFSTPGHSKGSSCLLLEKKLFSGDTLFAGGIWGRTDLWDGSPEDMQMSLAKLMQLDDEVVVYPGHGPSSVIREERVFYE